MALLPLFHNLADRPVLLVGAGTVARDKLRALLLTGARVHIVALHALPDVVALAEAHECPLERRPFAPQDLRGKVLVVSATNDPSLNASIATLARRARILVNAVDDPAGCDVFFASCLQRGPVTLAIGSEGRFPGLSRSLRQAMEVLLPERDADLLEALAEMRQELSQRLPDSPTRRAALLHLIETFRTAYLLPESPS